MRQVFLIPLDKTKFATSRESILSSPSVSLKTLQPAQLMSSSNTTATVQGGLCFDVAYWHFLTIGIR